MIPPVEIVLLHGFGLGAGSWGPVVEELSGRLTGDASVLAVEMCPSGAYRRPPEVVLDALAGRPPALRLAVGHSLGSHVVLDLVARDPGWAQAMLLLSVGSDEADPHFFRDRAHAYADLLRTEGVAGFAARFLPETRFRDSTGILRHAALLEEVILAGDPLALAECADDYLPYEELTSSLIARIGPTADWSMWSVLAGIGDAPAVEWVPAARALMPGASVSVIDGVAHLLPTDCPDVVADEILRLVELLQEKATPR